MRNPHQLLALIPLLALTFTAAAPAHAQTGTLTGAITNAVTGQPIVGAVVSVEGTGLTARSGPGGRYSMVNVPSGEQNVTVTRIGYLTQRRQVTVVSGRTEVADFALLAGAIIADSIRGGEEGGGGRAGGTDHAARCLVHCRESARVPAALQHRILRQHRRERLQARQRLSPLHLLDRRGPGVLRKHPPLHPGRRAAAGRRGAHRGDDQLLPLRLGPAERRAPIRGHHRGLGGSLEVRAPAGPDRPARPVHRHRGPPAQATWSSCWTCPDR